MRSRASSLHGWVTGTALGRAWLLGLGAVGCIDTEVEPLLLTECASPVAEDNVVFIVARVDDAITLNCSGVLLTRTLVATALGCTMVPSRFADGHGREKRPSGTIGFADAPGPSVCSEGHTIEEGSFAAWYGPPLLAESFSVFLPAQDVTGNGQGVDSVHRVGTSPCSPGLALLELSAGFAAEPLPLRFAESFSAGEPVQLSYLRVAGDFTAERQDLSRTISLPPSTGAARAFALDETCPDQSGGAVFSSATGALLGVLGSSRGAPRCTALGAGSAVPIALFRRLLIDVADPELLEIESGPPATNVVHCSPP